MPCGPARPPPASSSICQSSVTLMTQTTDAAVVWRRCRIVPCAPTGVGGGRGLEHEPGEKVDRVVIRRAATGLAVVVAGPPVELLVRDVLQREPRVEPGHELHLGGEAAA